MSGIARAIIETLDETSTLDDVTDVCNALNLYMDCKEEQSQEVVE